jgi:hypothetical protein
MADMSKLFHGTPSEVDEEVVRAGIDVGLDAREVAALMLRMNVSPEAAVSLRDRILDAESVWRYFCRRDEMNAEIHNEGVGPSVRYSPITIAAERLAGWLSRLYYGRSVDYRTATLDRPPDPVVIAPGVNYAIQLRATPDTDGSGHRVLGAVMWSADLLVSESGSGLTASGDSPADALAKLSDVIRRHL